MTASKKIKCKRKKLVPKHAIESGNKWGYRAQWGLVDLGKDFCLYLKEVESHWRILSKGVTEVHFGKIMRGAVWRENYRTKSASKETQKMVIEVFQERDGGGQQQGCWRRWRQRGQRQGMECFRALKVEEMMDMKLGEVKWRKMKNNDGSFQLGP